MESCSPRDLNMLNSNAGPFKNADGDGAVKF